MDATSEKLVDLIVEDEIQRGYKVKAVPADLLEDLPVAERFPAIRFVKLTPKKRRLIAEVVQRRYHADLKNKDILSNAQLRALNVERGEWSDAMERELVALTDETNRLMRDLWLDGIDRRDEWAGDLLERVRVYRTGLQQTEDPSVNKDQLLAIFDRWIGYEPSRQAEYEVLYGPGYAPDRDFADLVARSPLDLTETLGDIEEIQQRLKRFTELLERRTKLVELQVKQSRMYQDSVEQRRETSEELARLFYTTERVDAQGKPLGPLAPDFDTMWDLPDALVQWLLVEAYFFANGIPDEARPYLEQWGFIPAPRATGSTAPSDASPAEPSSSSASSPAVPTPAASSDATPTS